MLAYPSNFLQPTARLSRELRAGTAQHVIHGLCTSFLPFLHDLSKTFSHCKVCKLFQYGSVTSSDNHSIIIWQQPIDEHTCTSGCMGNFDAFLTTPCRRSRPSFPFVYLPPQLHPLDSVVGDQLPYFSGLLRDLNRLSFSFIALVQQSLFL